VHSFCLGWVLKILIADDHGLFRDALKAIMHSIHTDCTYCEAANLQETRQLCAAHPDAALMLIDLNMPGMSRVEDIAQIHKLIPGIPLVVVSMYSESEVIQKAFNHGASGYIPKTYDAKKTKQAISMVLSGGRYVPEEILHATSLALDGPHLTRRQKEVLKLVLQGNSNQAIADALYLTLSAVKMHVGNIMRKYDVKSRIQLITMQQNKF